MMKPVQGIVNNLESQAEIQAKIVGGPNLAGRGIGPQGAKAAGFAKQAGRLAMGDLQVFSF